jgi:hypothetical protein
MNGPSGKPLTNPVLTLSLVPPDLNSRAVILAFPKHSNRIINNVQFIDIRPTFYDGDITEYFPAGRDRVLLPAPCYRPSMIIHGGASGGPSFVYIRPTNGRADDQVRRNHSTQYISMPEYVAVGGTGTVRVLNKLICSARPQPSSPR